MSKTERNWTGNIHLGSKVDIDVVLNQLVHAFNSSPFFKHNGMSMRVVEGQIEAYVEMHDSVGGIVAMGELYKKAEPETIAETIKNVSRLATVDMRVDYLAPGRGKYFIARAETLRLGRKGCTMRMTMVNDEDKAIATAIASYAY